MAASVIDALVITLGLDTSSYDKGQKNVTEGMKKSRESAEATAKFMEQQGKKASSFFSSIKTELLALAGVSLSAAGLVTFTKNMTSGLMNMSIQANALGISVRQLDGWRKAADAAGSSAEKITGTLTTFQNAIQSAKSGDMSSPIFRALALLSSDTGVTFDPFKMNSDEMLKSVSSALQKEKSGDRARYLAQQLGIDDATLQAIRSGQFVSNANRYSAQSGINNADIENAKRFNVQWTTLQQKLEQTGYYVFNALSPYIGQFNNYLMRLADWVNQHPKEIHDAIRSFFDAISDVAKEIDDVVQKIGGWKVALEALVAVKVFSWAMGLVGAFTSLSKTVLPPWLAGLIAYGTYAVNDKENIKDAASGSWNYTKRNIGDALAAIGIKTDIGRRDVSEVRKHPQWLDWLMGPGEVLREGQSNGVVYGQNLQSDIPGGYFPQATGKGKALLDFMSTQFGQLEAKYGLPAGLLRSVATVESGGNPYATSGAGARGLFQFMPGTAKDLGINPLDPSQAANGAARYLRQLLNQTGGNLEDALAAYNWGIGNVQKKGRGASPLETQMYVPKVLAGLPQTGAAASAYGYFPMSAAPAKGQEININGVTINSPATKIDALTKDIIQTTNNRVRLAGYESGQY